MHTHPETADLERQNELIQNLLQNSRRREGQPDPLPADPDEAAALALSAILDPTAAVLPADLFKELARRNTQLQNAPADEIKATLARQIVLLESLAIRQFQKASLPGIKQNASEAFVRAGLATERVLIQALSAVYQISKNEDVGGSAVLDHDEE